MTHQKRITCSKVHLHEIVCDNGEASVTEWMLYKLANKVFVALVIWVYGHCCITQHCLDTCGSHNDLLIYKQR